MPLKQGLRPITHQLHSEHELRRSDWLVRRQSLHHRSRQSRRHREVRCRTESTRPESSALAWTLTPVTFFGPSTSTSTTKRPRGGRSLAAKPVTAEKFDCQTGNKKYFSLSEKTTTNVRPGQNHFLLGTNYLNTSNTLVKMLRIRR